MDTGVAAALSIGDRESAGRGAPPCYSRRVKIAVVIPALDESDRVATAIASVLDDAAVGTGACGMGPAPYGEAPVPVPASGAPEAEGVAGRGLQRGARDLDIVVVDGGSRDDTRERARRAGARVVESRQGRARQLQAGLEASDGELVLLLHADTRLPSGWRAAVEAALADPGVVGGAFSFRFDRRSPALRLVELGVRLRNALFALPYGDQALFARRGALEAVGGIPDVPLMEDLDLVRALKRRGRLALLPCAVETSARRYREGGVLRTMWRHWQAAAAWALGVDRERVAAWYRR